MRLRIFGIPKILLVFLGLLPTAIWCLFHPSLLSFHERAFVTALTAGLVFCRHFYVFFYTWFFWREIRSALVFFSRRGRRLYQCDDGARFFKIRISLTRVLVSEWRPRFG